MTQPIEPGAIPDLTNIPVALLREALKIADDESLTAFLQNYSLGVSADLFIRSMTAAGQRKEFFLALARTYSEDWNAAVKEQSEG